MKGSRFENIRENNIKKAALGIGSSVVLLGVIAGGILYNHNKQVQADQINSELAFVRKETNAMKSQKNDQKRINDLSKLDIAAVCRLQGESKTYFMKQFDILQTKLAEIKEKIENGIN